MEGGEKKKTDQKNGGEEDVVAATETPDTTREETEMNHVADKADGEANGDSSPGGEETKGNPVEEVPVTNGKSTEDESSGVADGQDDMAADGQKDRNTIYEQAVQLERHGKDDAALQKYLKCLENLESSNNFKSLPQCLHKIADLYFTKEEYDKAIQFIQAEKMYYETALIDIASFHKNFELAKRAGNKLNVNKSPPESLQGRRASEYEDLAKACLNKSQPHLALEYQGKATKLRQALYGSEHPITKKSLDFFTVIYGEVGKLQYSESMQKYSDNPVEDISTAESEAGPGKDVSSPASSDSSSHQSILRNRKGSTARSRNDSISKQVQFDEQTLLREESRMQEESISRILLWGLFGIILIVLVALIVYTYCRSHGSSKSCRDLRATFSRYYMMIKYWFYVYFGGNHAAG